MEYGLKVKPFLFCRLAFFFFFRFLWQRGECLRGPARRLEFNGAGRSLVERHFSQDCGADHGRRQRNGDAEVIRRRPAGPQRDVQLRSGQPRRALPRPVQRRSSGGRRGAFASCVAAHHSASAVGDVDLPLGVSSQNSMGPFEMLSAQNGQYQRQRRCHPLRPQKHQLLFPVAPAGPSP